MTGLPFEPSECLALVNTFRNRNPSVDSAAKVKLSPITRPTNTEVRKLKIADIDLSLQVRVRTDDNLVEEYAQHLKAGGTLARPLVYVESATNWAGAADGNHTVLAHRMNKGNTAEIECDVVEGTKSEARLVACVANATHGKNLSIADRRKIVTILWAEKPESKKWSSRDTATYLRHAVSHTTVAEMKKELEGRKPVSPDKSKKLKKPRPASVNVELVAAAPVEAPKNTAEMIAFLEVPEVEDEPLISVAEAIELETIAAESLDDEQDLAELEAEAEALKQEPPPPASVDPIDDNELIEFIPETAWKVTIVDAHVDGTVSLYAETAGGTKVLLRTTIVGRDVARAAVREVT